MSVIELIDEVHKTGAKLHLVGNELTIRAPRGALDIALKTKINERRSELAEHLRKSDTAGEFLQFVNSPRPDVLPLSFAQERLWFLDQLQPGGSEYNMIAISRSRGGFDHAAFEQAAAEVVRRHEVLRTRFENESGEARQVIDPPGLFKLEREDLQGVGEEEGRRRAHEEGAKPFDLERGPLFRVRVFELAADDHLILVVIHHILCDGWSVRILNTELDTLYRAFLDKKPSPLPELPVQYADYARWQRKRLQGDALEQQLEYWRKTLAGASVLQLPTDRIRPPVQSFKGAGVHVVLPPELFASLENLARAEGTTLFMVMLAAFQLLLARWSGQEDVVVGSPMAGRNAQSLEGLIGFFVNTLVLRTDLSGNPTFRELVGRVKDVALGAYDHQDVPFEKIVEALQPARDLSRHPIFQVLFNALDFEARRAKPVESAGRGRQTTTPTSHAAPAPGHRPPLAVPVAAAKLPHEPMPVAPHKGPPERSPLAVMGGNEAKFDLTLYFRNVGGLKLFAVYNVDLFESATIEQLLQHYCSLLEGIVRDPNKPIWELPLLDRSEQSKLVDDWNQTSMDFPVDKTLHELFMEQAARTPDAIALVSEHSRLSYRELDERSNRLAHHLRGLDVGPESVVGICIDRTIDMIVGLLGILKAGGAYMPLDPAYPVERIAYMLDDAGASVVVTQANVESSLGSVDVRRVRLDADSTLIDEHPLTAPVNLAHPHNLAYVIYTSGSTGKPKGVMNEHRQSVNYTFGVKHRLPFDGLRNMAMVQSLTVGSVISVLYPALLSGATLHIISRDRALDAEACRRYFVENDIDSLKIAPSHLAALIAESARPQELLPVLVIVAGEPSPTSWMKKTAALNPRSRIFNHFGATETTIGVLTYPITSDLSTDIPNVPLGKPLPNCQVYVLDRELNPVPPGVVGEIYVGGDNLTRGYLRRAALTASKFVPNPFGDGARLYCTNDLGRLQPDGTVQYLGRQDNQLKIRGFRVELGEIEAALLSHPAVRQAIVLPKGAALTERKLVAYAVPESGQTIDVAGLRGFLKGTLPEHMLPSAIVVLDALPRTAHGKVDRQALPTVGDEVQAAVEFVTPRSPTEETLAAIWAEVLQQKRVGIFDDFFELGGHSLLATRVIARVRDRFAVELPVRAIFEAPVLHELAERIDRLEGEGRWSLPALVAQERKGGAAVPLSFAQERLWILDQLQPGGSEYNISIAFRLSGVLDMDALKRSLGEIVRRHEVLRTHFEVRDGNPVQVIDDALEVPLAVEDLSGLQPAEREEELKRRVGELTALPFDLAAGSLLRATLVKLGEDQHAVVLVLHHIISDGWSRGVLIGELTRLYGAYASGGESPLPEPRLQYADYACWQRDWLQGENLQRRLDYWRAQLAGAPAAIELPADRARPPVQSFQGATLQFALPSALSHSLDALAREQRATLFMILLAAFKVVLSRWSGQDDIVVGTPIAGRTRQELEGLLGFFVNTLALRTDLSGDPSFDELIDRIKKVSLEAYEHQDFPFERLVQELQPDRDLSRQPLFQVMFALQNMPGGSPKLPGLNWQWVLGEGTTSKFDLSLFLYQTADGALFGWFEYSTALFNRATMDALLRQYTLALETIVGAPKKQLSEIGALLSPPAIEIAISSTFTADPIVDPLWLWMERMGLTARIKTTGYNQILQSLLAERPLSMDPRQVHLILLRLEDWGRRIASRAGDDQRETLDIKAIERNAEEFVTLLRDAAAAGKGYCLVGVCPASPDVLASRKDALRLEVIEQRLVDTCRAIPQVRLLSLDDTAKALKLATVHDSYLDKVASIPYSPPFFASAATSAVRTLLEVNRHIYKVIVVDCDNTLWKGICGEDGPHGVTITHGRRLLQEYLVQLSGKGVLVCLCSRNNEADALEVFRANPDMVLSLDDITSHRIGWGPKPAAIAELAKELDLALNSFVFLDDDPIECARMEAEQPDVLTIALPSSDVEIVNLLDRLWMFDGAGATSEDRQRTRRYREERLRHDERRHSPSLQEFISGLELKIIPQMAEAKDVDRVVQITERTTQFNTTGLKLGDGDVRAIIGSPARLSFIIDVSDRFGDYGKSGLLVLDRSAEVWRVELFALSCRVLGRDVEFRIVERLVEEARKAGGDRLSFDFRPTPRNMPAQAFLRELCRLVGASPELNATCLFSLSDLAAALQRRREAGTMELAEAVPDVIPEPREATQPLTQLDFKVASHRFGRLVAAELRTVGEIVTALRTPAIRPGRKAPVVYQAPRTSTEGGLVGIWCEVLRLEKVGVHDNFFELGGHSLLATRMMARVRETFGIELALRVVFEAPTIADLALKVEKQANTPQADRESDLRAQIASMSPEEIKAALERMKVGG